MLGFEMSAPLLAVLLHAAASASPPASTASPGFRAQCLQGTLDIDRLLEEEAVKGLLDKARAMFNDEFTDPEAMDFEAYLACKGIALGGGTETCAPFKGLGHSFIESYRTCRELQSLSGLIWSALRGGGAAAACRGYVALSGDRRGARVEPLCAVLVQALRQGLGTKAFCTELEGSGALSPAQVVDCQAGFVFLNGDPRECSEIANPNMRYECRETSALVAAARSGREADCRKSPLCRAESMREPSACEPYRRKAVGWFCRKYGI